MLSPKDLSKILLDKKAVQVNKEKPFTWASGIQSPIYCDNRKLISHPRERSQIVESLVEIIQKHDFDFLAGTATAGIPWCAMVAQSLNCPMVYVRSKPKEHGLENLIEGEITGKRCLVIEDLISTGKSSLNVVKTLQDNKVDVVSVVSLFSYELESARLAFQEMNISYQSLASRLDLEQVLGEKIVIPES